MSTSTRVSDGPASTEQRSRVGKVLVSSRAASALTTQDMLFSELFRLIQIRWCLPAPSTRRCGAACRRRGGNQTGMVSVSMGTRLSSTSGNRITPTERSSALTALGSVVHSRTGTVAQVMQVTARLDRRFSNMRMT
ncbi:hypothetical protein ACVMFA_004214 [Bradyrhizobium liaoningense]